MLFAKGALLGVILSGEQRGVANRYRVISVNKSLCAYIQCIGRWLSKGF